MRFGSFPPRHSSPSSATMYLPITRGKACPRCGTHTYREPTPWYLRPLRWLLLGHASYRRCGAYDWQGLAIHR